MPFSFIVQLSKLIKLMIQAIVKDGKVQCPQGHSGQLEALLLGRKHSLECKEAKKVRSIQGVVFIS